LEPFDHLLARFFGFGLITAKEKISAYAQYLFEFATRLLRRVAQSSKSFDFQRKIMKNHEKYENLAKHEEYRTEIDEK